MTEPLPNGEPSEAELAEVAGGRTPLPSHLVKELQHQMAAMAPMFDQFGQQVHDLTAPHLHKP